MRLDMARERARGLDQDRSNRSATVQSLPGDVRLLREGAGGDG